MNPEERKKLALVLEILVRAIQELDQETTFRILSNANLEFIQEFASTLREYKPPKYLPGAHLPGSDI